MPGGFGGGGKPPIHRCPRCGWKSEDQLQGSLIGIGIGAATITLVGATIAARTSDFWLPESAGATVALAALAVGLLGVLAVAAVARVRRLTHRCPSCGFTWPIVGWSAAHGHRARLEAICTRQGLALVAPGPGELARYTGQREGRSVTVSLLRGRAPVALVAVEHAGRASARLEAELARAIDEKLRRSVAREVHSDERALSALVELPLDLDDLEDAIGVLVHAADELDRGTVHVEPRDETHARCAYCHQDLAERDAELVHCVRCSTVLHAGCWDELGRCPALGCGSRDRERPPERGATR